jgi:hypothetical protein
MAYKTWRKWSLRSEQGTGAVVWGKPCSVGNEVG